MYELSDNIFRLDESDQRLLVDEESVDFERYLKSFGTKRAVGSLGSI